MKVAFISLILALSLVLFSCGGGASGKKLYLPENAYGDDDGDGVLNYEDDFPKDPTRWKKDRPAISFYDCVSSKPGSECLPKLLRATPFTINTQVKFYKDVSYRPSNTEDEEHTRMDLFLPNSASPTSYVMFIHGGAFINDIQTKSSYYKVTSSTGGNSYRDYINNFLSKNIAFISIDYRLLSESDKNGIYRSLNDIKYALQFIKKHAGTFNLKPEQVALMGNSAGMSSGLWLGLKERADSGNSDLVERESTRVKAIVGTEPQASLHMFDWVEYLIINSQPFDFGLYHSANSSNLDRTCNLTKLFYGVSPCTKIFNADGSVHSPTDAEVQRKADDLDIRKYLNANSPPLYVKNKAADINAFPSDFEEVVHHPLHVQELKKKADAKGITGSYKYGTEDTTGGKDMDQFIIDILEPNTP